MFKWKFLKCNSLTGVVIIYVDYDFLYNSLLISLVVFFSFLKEWTMQLFYFTIIIKTEEILYIL